MAGYSRPVLMLLGAVCTGLGLGTSMVSFWEEIPLAEEWGTFMYKLQLASDRRAKRIALAHALPAEILPAPVVGVARSAIADTYGAPRSGGRRHEGLDIFAVRGAHVRSVTEGVVFEIGYGTLGGNYVFIQGPGGERYYYAHLDEIDPVLREGQIVTPLTMLGTVGATGNARDTVPHLHFGVYGTDGARNPYPRFAGPYPNEEFVLD